MSLDRMADILSWPAGELDPAQLNAQVIVARVVAMIGCQGPGCSKRGGG
jgi:hypothetical protein